MRRRGRPLKYQTTEERNQARQEVQRRYNQARRFRTEFQEPTGLAPRPISDCLKLTTSDGVRIPTGVDESEIAEIPVLAEGEATIPGKDSIHPNSHDGQRYSQNWEPSVTSSDYTPRLREFDNTEDTMDHQVDGSNLVTDVLPAVVGQGLPDQLGETRVECRRIPLDSRLTLERYLKESDLEVPTTGLHLDSYSLPSDVSTIFQRHTTSPPGSVINSLQIVPETSFVASITDSGRCSPTSSNQGTGSIRSIEQGSNNNEDFSSRSYERSPSALSVTLSPSQQSYILSEISSAASTSDESNCEISSSYTAIPDDSSAQASSLASSHCPDSFDSTSDGEFIGEVSQDITHIQLQSGNSHTTGDSSLPSDLEQVDLVAEFLTQQMLSLSGCTKAEHEIEDGELRRTNEISTDEPRTVVVDTVRPMSSASIRAGMDEIPFVLAEPAFLEDDHGPITPEVAKKIYSGSQVIGGQECQERISFAFKEQDFAAHIAPKFSFDIDSVITFPSNLAFAKQGIKVCFAPLRHCNIQSNLHIEIPIATTASSRTQSRNIPVHQIPHFQLGYVYQSEEYKVFLMFPGLWHSHRRNSYLSDNQLERFMDEVFLPAIEQQCSPNIRQHLPGSFHMAQQVSRAATAEGGSRDSGHHGRAFSMYYPLREVDLAGIWTNILSKVAMNNFQDFGGVQILVNAKNLKLSTMYESPVTAITSFLHDWDGKFNATYLISDRTWIDFACEIIKDSKVYREMRNLQAQSLSSDYRPSGLERSEYCFMWRRCCLKSFISQFKRRYPNQSFRSQLFVWGLTSDIANLSMVPSRWHTTCCAGLAFSQYYCTIKEIFDAARVYPFQNENLEILAVDPRLSASWTNLDGHSNPNNTAMRKRYLASKQRVMSSLYSSTEKSFGTRQEHRVKLPLLHAMHQQFQRRQQLAEPTQEIGSQFLLHRPFYIVPTFEIGTFLGSNINRYCFGLEYVLLKSHNTSIDWEHTRVMTLFLRLLSLCFSGSALERYPELWKSEYNQRQTNAKRKGLNFQQVIHSRGYGFLPNNLIDWRWWQFHHEITNELGICFPGVGHNSGTIPTLKFTTTTLYDQFSRVLANMRRHPGNVTLRRTSCHILSCTLIELFREDIWNTLQHDPLFKPLVGHRLMERDASLCVTNLRSLLHGDLTSFKFIQNYNRHTFHPFERVTYLWDYDTTRDRGSWSAKPWRMLFTTLCTQLTDMYPGSNTCSRFRDAHFHRFLHYNLVFPQPISDKFHQKCKDRLGNLRRSWYCAFNLTGEFLWIAKEWETGSPDEGRCNHNIPRKMRYSTKLIPELLDCIEGDSIVMDRLRKLARYRETEFA
ncbi:hypothetical protein HOY82DRAFT_541495 [Tuber indicum]|nr:hypothetical protein HOY82DRAFT_541495 [Tuber indicum]